MTQITYRFVSCYRCTSIRRMDEVCALCRSRAVTSSIKKKQKYLNRGNCRDERVMLSKLLGNRHPEASCSSLCSCFAVLHSQTSMLCMYCQRQLLRIKKLEEEICTLLGQVNKKIDSIHQGCKYYTIEIYREDT